MRPKVFMPIHHDDFLPPFTSRGDVYYRPLVAELAKIPAPQRPRLCFLTDPDSYETPFAFTTSEWAGPAMTTISGCRHPA